MVWGILVFAVMREIVMIMVMLGKKVDGIFFAGIWESFFYLPQTFEANLNPTLFFFLCKTFCENHRF